MFLSRTLLTKVNRPLYLNTLARFLHIQTASTPNEDALKFLPSQEVLGPGTKTIEYLTMASTANSPLASKLFKIPGVASVLLGPDFITVEKEPEEEWPIIKPTILSLLHDHISNNEPIIDENENNELSLNSYEDDNEVVSMIKELIDTRIRPAIQEDGGDIDFMGFTDDGIVQLKLQGACRSCDSSSVTLQNGIESMLMHYIEEVKGVEQVMDEQEKAGIQEFEKFEAKLNSKKKDLE